MLMRWVIELQAYDFTVKYRPGEQHGDADGISRIVYDQLLTNSNEEINALNLRSGRRIRRNDVNNNDEVKEFDKDDVLVNNFEKSLSFYEQNMLKNRRDFKDDDTYELYVEQHKCDWMLPLIYYLEAETVPLDSHKINFLKKNIEFYCLNDEGILYKEIRLDKRIRRTDDGTKRTKDVIVLPYTLCEQVLELGHNDKFAGHQGRLKTFERIRDKYFWPKMKADIYNYVDACVICGRYKGERNFRFGKRQKINDYTKLKPFDFIVADAIGPLPETKNKNKYIITITDYFTRWVEAVPVRDLKSSTWIIVLEDFVCRFGVPAKLLTDQGGNFIADLAKLFYQILGIDKRTSTGYHPETQGLDERVNGTLIKIVRMYVNEFQSDWDSKLKYALFAYRTSYHETIKDSPFYLIYGRDARTPLDIKFINPRYKVKKGSVVDYRRNIVDVWRRSRLLVANELSLAQTKIISSKANDRRIEVEFEIGSPVWVYCYFRKRNEDDPRIAKLAYKWHGPFRILKKISMNVYEVDVNTKSVLINVNRLKVFKGFWSRPQEEIEEDELNNTPTDGSVDDVTILNYLPVESFISNTTSLGGDEVIINSEKVIDKVVDKRVNKSKGKNTIEYLLLLANGEFVWKDVQLLGSFHEIIDDFENKLLSKNQDSSLRRSQRVKDIDHEVGESRTYYN